MGLFNGDRVCVKEAKNKISIGRVCDYVEEPTTGSLDGNRSDDVGGAGGHFVFPPGALTQSSPSVPGYESPMVRSRSQPNLMHDADGNLVNGTKRHVVWDKDASVTDVRKKDERVFKVIDRKFNVGQNVFNNGQRGKVVQAIPVVTVQVVDYQSRRCINPNLITHVEMENLRPITPLFYGVNIEFMGWIGQISDVQRTAVYKLDDSTRLSRTFQDSVLFQQNAQIPCKREPGRSIISGPRRRSPIQFGYPYMPWSVAPYNGKIEKMDKLRVKQFRQDEVADKENNGKYCGLNESTGSSRNTDLGDFVTAKTELVEIVSIAVRWTGRLPEYLIKLSDKKKVFPAPLTPPNTLRGEDLKFVRGLYIHPATYFDKEGLCLYTLPQDNSLDANQLSNLIIPEKRWLHQLYNSLGRPEEESENENDDDDETTCKSSSVASPATTTPPQRKDFHKRKRCLQDPGEESEQGLRQGKDVIVCKHFVRNKYKVIWDGNRKNYFSPRPVGQYYGSQLEPDLRQEHKLCLGLIHSHLYVLPKAGSWMKRARWDYGVVIEKPNDTSVVVEWLTICRDGSVAPARVLRCELVEIDKHPSFNELHEGRIVVRKQDADVYEVCKDFRFGTIVSVQRFALGQISVYCPIQRRVLELWPHMLELFAGMSIQELISRKVVGLRRCGRGDEHDVRNCK